MTGKMQPYKRKYQQGGKVRQNPPIYTADKSKVQAYNDSLMNFNNSKAIIDYANNTGKLIDERDGVKDNVKPGSKKMIEYDRERFPLFMASANHELELPDQVAMFSKPGWDFTKDYRAHFKQPVQPYIYQEPIKNSDVISTPLGVHIDYPKTYPVEPKWKPHHSNIQQLPISQPNQLPTDIQYTPEQLQVPNYRTTGDVIQEPTYGAPRVVNGQVDIPRQYQQGGKMSTQGYKRNSPDRHEKSLTIPSNRITMKNVDTPVYGIGSNGHQQIMYPGGEYSYPGAEYVQEYPINAQYNNDNMNRYKNGGDTNTIGNLKMAQYQLYKDGGQVNPAGMFWDGTRWVKGNPNTGMQYQQGGDVNTIGNLRMAQYQLYENGGQIASPAQGIYQFEPYHSGGSMMPGMQPAYQDGGTVDDLEMAQYQLYKNGGDWIKGAVNPAHKGYCTPMTKSTCTPRRKAFAETMKKHHGFHKQDGGYANSYGGSPALSKFMQTGGEYDENYDPGIGQYPPSSYDQSNTGVIPQISQPQDAPWRGNMTDQQSQDNIDYGQGSTAAYNPATGNTGGGKRRDNPYGPLASAAGNVVTGAIAVGDYYNGQRNAMDVHQNAQAMGLTGASGYQTGQGTKGDYNRNSGQFRIQDRVPTNAGYYAPATMQHGGYTAGSEHEMSDSEISRLKKLGYKIQML